MRLWRRFGPGNNEEIVQDIINEIENGPEKTTVTNGRNLVNVSQNGPSVVHEGEVPPEPPYLGEKI